MRKSWLIEFVRDWASQKSDFNTKGSRGLVTDGAEIEFCQKTNPGNFQWIRDSFFGNVRVN